jgi:hypothetical protein
MAFDGNCEIRRAGIRPDGRAQVDMRAVNGAFDWNWFVSNPEKGKEVLAVALTAIASGKQIACTIENESQPFAEVGFFGIVK